MTSTQSDFKCKNTLALIILSVLFIMFVLFTYYTPKIGLFKDPINNEYGIMKQKVVFEVNYFGFCFKHYFIKRKSKKIIEN